MAGDLPEPELASAAPRFLAWPARVHPLLALPLLLAVSLLLAGSGYLASQNYPHPGPPKPSDIEKHAAAVFGLPIDTSDGSLEGDLLVERFYAIDVENGEQYVGDVLKGRIQAIQAGRPDGGGPFTLVLDLRNLQRDRALYAAYVDQVARPEGNYLGLRVLPGVSDAFMVNYNGSLPPSRATFHGPSGESIYEYLLQQSFVKATAEPHLVGVDGTHFYLSSTDRFTFFRIEFRTGKAVLMSELLIVDTTARPQRLTFFNLQEQYRRTPTPR